MKVFMCKACRRISYPVIELENHVNKNCPFCGADMRRSAEGECVMCGSYVPEGRMVCPACEADPFHGLKERRNKGAYNKDGE